MMMMMTAWIIVKTRGTKRRDTRDLGLDLCHNVYFVLCNIRNSLNHGKMCKNLPGLRSLDKTFFFCKTLFVIP